VRLDGESEKAEGVGKFQAAILMDIQIRNKLVTCAGALLVIESYGGYPFFSGQVFDCRRGWCK
jgi:hypothetical protein